MSGSGFPPTAIVTVNLDGEHALLAMDPQLERSDKTLSTARYGVRRGVDALLRALENAGVTATWFVPGALARSHPGVVTEVAEGHEIGLRGDEIVPLTGLTDIERREALDRAMGALTAAGSSPRSFRLPMGEWPLGLVDDLLALGFEASSSFAGDDLPFTLPGGAGQIVEIPFHYAADDRQSFEWNFSPAIPSGHSRIASYEDVLENWKWEFDASHREGVLFVLSVSPHIIGTPGRIGLLEEALAHMTAAGAVFATVRDAAARWRGLEADRGPAHPLAVFLRESARAGL